MDVYTQPSSWEGICFALLEAMSTARPCVVTDLPVFHEVCEGVDASLVPVDDAIELADGIDRFIIDPQLARDSGQASRERWTAAFTVERMVSAHDLAYQARLSE
jgi:glycosyltransferase involved in cell wall biosynthesis